MSADPVFLGLDLGTGGVRVVAATSNGEVLATADKSFDRRSEQVQEAWHEQDAESWWRAVSAAIRDAIGQIRQSHVGAKRIKAIAVDGTSGTLVCVDRHGRCLRPPIMYNDGRADREAVELTERAGPFCAKLGYRIAASYAAAKIRWIQRHEPACFKSTRWFLHQADFVSNRLTGAFGATDYSNALKTCYDLVEERWPAWIDHFDGIRQRLPEVVAPGTDLGKIDANIAKCLELPDHVKVVSGATDGMAAFVASGVTDIGDDNTTLGTTLVFKRLSDRLANDPRGPLYSHKMPDGRWLPGGASNTGGEWIARDFAHEDLATLDGTARPKLPSNHLAYPLARTGERFPFSRPDAEGFCEPRTTDRGVIYAAKLQGVALVERLSYEMLDKATGLAGRNIYATGAASRSDVWLQLRADVTQRTIHRPTHPSSAFGSAILAASATNFSDLWSAMHGMVRIARSFQPDASLAHIYDEKYDAFTDMLRQRGYLDGKTS